MAGLAHLFVFSCYGHQLSRQEDLVLYDSLAPSTNGKEISKVLSSVFEFHYFSFGPRGKVVLTFERMVQKQ